VIHDQRLLDMLLRNDFYRFVRKAFGTVVPGEPFLPNWHIEAICFALEQVRIGKIKRLIINVPPRSLKSIIASVAFPAFVLGRDPTAKIISASYSNDLAAKHATDTKAVMRSPWFKRIFPASRIGTEKDAESDFMTTMRGGRYATSVGGTLTGRGGNLIIIDDPLKPGEAISQVRREAVNSWYDQTVLSRLNNKAEDAIVVVMQRLHLDDLVGHVLEQLVGWKYLIIPAVAETLQSYYLGGGRRYDRPVGEVLHAAREPHHVLDEMHQAMGSYAFSAQYQQRPIPLEGEIVKWSWFKRYDEPPTASQGYIVQSWDTAMSDSDTADYSVCTTWRVVGQDYYLVDVFRKRLTFPELKRAVVEQGQHRLPRTIVIEDKGFGSAIIQQLRTENLGRVPRPIAFIPRDDKRTRLHAQSAIIEQGRVHLPNRASWLDAFQSELAQFPQGKHDDQVDSVSQFLNWITERAQRSSGIQEIRMG